MERNLTMRQELKFNKEDLSVICQIDQYGLAVIASSIETGEAIVRIPTHLWFDIAPFIEEMCVTWENAMLIEQDLIEVEYQPCQLSPYETLIERTNELDDTYTDTGVDNG